MTTIADQHRASGESSSISMSPTEAYVRWIRDELDSGRWNSDPNQPCLLYKVYRGVERLPLDLRFPLRLGSSRRAFLDETLAPLQASPEQYLAWLLFYTHGLTRIIRPAPGSLPSMHEPAPESRNTLSAPVNTGGPRPFSHPFLGRPVPSGGSLHPVEIYLAIGTQWNIPPGIYHYDSVHHALDLLRPGVYLADIAACLPPGNDISDCPAVLLPASFFQKNHQKYTNMSYRLQTLDTGIVIEQLRFMVRRFGLQTRLYLQFLDRPLHHLAGLDMQEEAIYGIISLKEEMPSFSGPAAGSVATMVDRAPQAGCSVLHLPSVAAQHIQPFVPLARSPLLDSLHAASLQETLPVELTAPAVPSETEKVEDWLPLPQANFTEGEDLAQVLLRWRRTSFNAIDTRPLQASDLATVLAYAGKLLSEVWFTCDCHIYCVVSRVPGIEPGVYRYSPSQHALSLIHSTNLTPLLMRITTAPNIHPHMAPVNIFLTGDYLRARHHFGERGFRIMGIEIGRAIQGLSLAAAGRHLAVHIHLSYLFEATRQRLLHLASPSQLPLASMMIGYPRSTQGNLLEMVWY